MRKRDIFDQRAQYLADRLADRVCVVETPLDKTAAVETSGPGMKRELGNLVECRWNASVMPGCVSYNCPPSPIGVHVPKRATGCAASIARRTSGTSRRDSPVATETCYA